MLAVFQTKYGNPGDLELREVDVPIVGDDEVLVQVHAASVHPDVWHAVSGRPYIFRLMGAGVFKPRNPIPGTDMAGIVESVGKNVKNFRLGDKVFGETGESGWNGGAFSEYVSVRQDLLAIKPDNISFEQAAAVPTSGFIALQNLRDPSRLESGRRVLVNGAGGGVGSIALQIAKSHGAHVTGVDCTNKQSLVNALGADRFIDHTQEDFTQSGDRYDLIFDIPANRRFSEMRKALKPDGRYIPIGHYGFGASGKTVFGILPHFFKLIFLSRFVKQLRGPNVPLPSKKEAVATMRNLLAAGKIRPIIDSTYPLSEVREALRHMAEDELQGKVIIVVGKGLTRLKSNSASNI